MEYQEICRHIDDGANFYLRILGSAEHMEIIDNDYYSLVRPRPGESGCSCVFNIRLENLSVGQQKEIIKEIKALQQHTWWGFHLSEEIEAAIYGADRPPAATETNEEEGCMAILPPLSSSIQTHLPHISVKKVQSAEDFHLLADMTNNILHGSYPMLHPVHHYPLCEEHIMSCYIAYYDNIPASVCTILNNKGVASLEFVCTQEAYRNKGLSRAACMVAISDTFAANACIITLRAFPHAKLFYKKLGFTLY